MGVEGSCCSKAATERYLITLFLKVCINRLKEVEILNSSRYTFDGFCNDHYTHYLK